MYNFFQIFLRHTNKIDEFLGKKFHFEVAYFFGGVKPTIVDDWIGENGIPNMGYGGLA